MTVYKVDFDSVHGSAIYSTLPRALKACIWDDIQWLNTMVCEEDYKDGIKERIALYKMGNYKELEKYYLEVQNLDEVIIDSENYSIDELEKMMEDV